MTNGDAIVHCTCAASVVAYGAVFFKLLNGVPQKHGLSYEQRLRVYLHLSLWSKWVDWLQAFLSAFSVLAFIAASYVTSTNPPTWERAIDVSIAVFFGFNYGLEYMLAKRKLAHVFSLMPVIDALTVLPIMVDYFVGTMGGVPTSSLGHFRILRITRVFRTMRIIRTLTYMSPVENAVRSQLLRLAGFFVGCIIMSTGIVQALTEPGTDEWDYEKLEGKSPMSFNDALYFIAITFTTVGYGDISPPTTVTRLVLVILVSFFFIVVPSETNKLVALMELRSEYTTKLPKRVVGGHILLCADARSFDAVNAFLEEFFHDDHGYNSKQVVLLVPEEPSMRWKGLVLQYALNDRVTYRVGDARSFESLSKVYAQEADACFIFSDRNTSNMSGEESKILMQALAVQDINPGIQLFVEAPNSDCRKKLVSVGVEPTKMTGLCWQRCPQIREMLGTDS